MNEPTEIAELEELLQECRSLYANLSERNAEVVGGWPRIPDPIHLFPGEGSDLAEHFDRTTPGSTPTPNDFAATLLNLQKQFLFNWRGLLRANLEIESVARSRAREQSELARLSEQVMLLSQSRAEASEEKARLKRDLERLKIESASSRETAARLEEQLGLRDKDLHALAAELAEREQDQHRIAENERKLSEDLKSLEMVRDHLDGRIEELEKELETLRGQVEPIESQLVESRNRVAELESELHFIREETVPKHQLVEVAENLESVLAEKKSLVEEKDLLKKEIDAIRKSLEDEKKVYEEAIEDLKRENERKEISLQSVEQRLKEMEGVLADRESLVLELESQAGKGISEAALAEMENKLTTTLTDLESYREQFHRLEIENKKLKETLGSASNLSRTKDPLPERETTPPSGEAPFDIAEILEKPEEFSDEESFARESRIADLEFREIESLESQWDDTSSQVLARESETPPRIATVKPESEDEPEKAPMGDPSFVQADKPPGSKTEEEVGHAFPYPEINREALLELEGKHVLLVGGDARFQQDYESLFQLGNAELEYHPSIIHLEKKGMKNSVREANLVVAFGGATQEPGLFRLRKICTDYGRHLLEHPSSGLVSLSQKLREAIKEV